MAEPGAKTRKNSKGTITMKRPTWATVIGIITIVFGVFGILGGAQHMMMPTMLEMQQSMMREFKNIEIPAEGKTGENAEQFRKHQEQTQRIFETFEKHMEVPAWYKTWSVVIGIVSMLVAGVYLLSGVFLLMTKPYAIRIFYAAMGLSMTWGLARAIILMQSDTLMLMSMLPLAVAGIVIDLVLLIAVLAGDKEAFHATGNRQEAAS